MNYSSDTNTSKDTLFLHQIHVESCIGILPYERTIKQTLIIDLDVELDFCRAAASDNILDALNYALLADYVVEFCKDSDCKLLEKLGEELSAAIFRQFAEITKLTLKIQKPAALVHTRNVGIIIVRERQQML